MGAIRVLRCNGAIKAPNNLSLLSCWQRAHHDSWTGLGNALSETGRSKRKKKDVSWDEKTSLELGKNANGAPLKTIDNLYHDCYEILSTKDTSKYDLQLVFDTAGILKKCLFKVVLLMDSSGEGVSIDEIRYQ